MAKALFGHVGLGADQRLAGELRRLRGRVTELEVELSRVRAANDALVASLTVEDDLSTLTVDASV